MKNYAKVKSRALENVKKWLMNWMTSPKYIFNITYILKQTLMADSEIICSIFWLKLFRLEVKV